VYGLLVILGLILLQAITSVAYAALINARTGILKDQAEDGDRNARKLLRVITSGNTKITYYTINTLIKFVIAAVGVVALAQPMIGDGNGIIIYVVTLVITACVVIVLGDTVPEAIGRTYADNLVYTAGGLMRGLVWSFRPIVSLMVRASKLLSSLARSSGKVNTITAEEIMTLIDAGHSGGTLEEDEKDMILSVLQLDKTFVSEVMIPRIDLTAVEINQTLEQAGRIFVKSGFSRIPVYEEKLDTIRGVLYAKDLLASWYNSKAKTQRTIQDLMRRAHFVPDTKRADELLQELQQRKIHMAIVVDEYGGTSGLVTIEDIIEEIIGDIQDEYDINEEQDYEQISDFEYTVDAGMDLDDFNDLIDVVLPTQDSDTLGGYIYTFFGRVPEIDEVIETDKFFLRVQSVDGRRIRKVYVQRYPNNYDEDDEGNEQSNQPDQDTQDTLETTPASDQPKE
jgi:putative hemolysin